MNEVNQIVIHRSYTEELLYNILKNDPVMLLQFFVIIVVGLLVVNFLFQQVRKSLMNLSNRFIKPNNQDPRQNRFRYQRENNKYIVLINIVSFIFTATVVTFAIMLIP